MQYCPSRQWALTSQASSVNDWVRSENAISPGPGPGETDCLWRTQIMFGGITVLCSCLNPTRLLKQLRNN